MGVVQNFEMIPKITYFVHDLSDPAVHRRVRMLVAGGADVTPIGFRRSAERIEAIEGIQVYDLGRTADGMLAKRAVSVIAALARLDGIAGEIRGSDVILARNLEMLAIAAFARRRYAHAATLVYECLDIHRKLLSNGLDGAALRFLESRLWRRVNLLITSSPAFVRNYFEPRKFPAAIKLAENKVLFLGDGQMREFLQQRAMGPPWRIGWFGMIRCRRSLEILRSIAQTSKGAVEVIIRGRPSGVVFPDFDTALSKSPHIKYEGPYKNPVDLFSIYSDVHFAWAIDYFEKDQNSAWLLPNRIYEGSFCGAVPIALEDGETGAWLSRRSVGVVLKEPLEERLLEFFSSLTESNYARLAQAVAALPLADLLIDRSECQALQQAMCRPPICSSEEWRCRSLV